MSKAEAICFPWPAPYAIDHLQKSESSLPRKDAFQPKGLVPRLLCCYERRCRSTTKLFQNLSGEPVPSRSQFYDVQGEGQKRNNGQAGTCAERDRWYPVNGL